MPPVSVLFVCTANISRSPYAEIRCRQLFGDQISAASAGIPGTERRTMDPAMEAVLPHEDPGALAHRSRVLTIGLLAQSDLVLTMEFTHQMRVLDQWPEAYPRVFGLRQFVEGLAHPSPSGSALERMARVASSVGPNSMVGDIDDPYQRGRRAARRCADELDELILRLGVGLGYEPVTEN